MVRAEERESHAGLRQMTSSFSTQPTVLFDCALLFLKLPAEANLDSSLVSEAICWTVTEDESARDSLCLLQGYDVTSHAVLPTDKIDKTLNLITLMWNRISGDYCSFSPSCSLALVPAARILGKVMFTRRDWVKNRLGKDLVQKILYDQLSDSDSGWASNVCNANRFWYYREWVFARWNRLVIKNQAV